MNFSARLNQLSKLLRSNSRILKTAALKLYSFFIAAVFFTAAVSACSLLQGSIKTSRESDNNTKKLIKENGIYINSITVHKSFDSDTVKKNASYAFDILIDPSFHETGKKGFSADAVLKEESFVKGFKQLNTVSLEFVIKDRSSRPVKFILISEETENTLSSYRYLFEILEKGIKETGL